MKAAVYLAHPRPGSFNHALADAVAAELGSRDCQVVTHDLYAEGFDPLLPADGTGAVRAAGDPDDTWTARHRAELATLDVLIFVHPNWWGMPPAVLTGWVQRVLAPGVAYKLGTADGEPVGLLSAGRALVLNTSDTPAEREEREFGDPLQRIWAACVLPYVGVSDVRRHVFRTVSDSTEGEREAWLEEARGLAAALVS
ncbi:NAD(P)H dehydrogenase [Streptomyces sp. NRRL F-5755]|uniref:NAD(P)H-dependent oxidoreductase n=1 Tax=Streptomyces sp. NRRL F-5755 TaxID=1519475 RepID=UPI0006AEE2E2|nr:NAD(P)H-dependent oxidoreductase [Streptomyces sp. NRRL F-5755]KOT86414.1 NAD(P)H dehydrogenase [Streptomyces sp. NRRL F-5755]